MNASFTLTDLIQIGPVYDALSEYLPTPDRLRLRGLSSTFRDVISSHPQTWKYLNLSGLSRDVVEHIISLEAVPGALEELTLDCTDVNETTIIYILSRCSRIRYLGLGGAMELMDGALQAVMTCKAQGCANKLRYLGILGAPVFKSTGVNGIAASIAKSLQTLGITTDLRPCQQPHAFTSDTETHWHLSAATPSVCHDCKRSVWACFPCLNGRTCRGCFKFWCFDCPSPITRVCFECGHSCKDCKSEIYVKCIECQSMFCKLHREDDAIPTVTTAAHGRTQKSDMKSSMAGLQDTCDWCIQGKATAFRERFRC